ACVTDQAVHAAGLAEPAQCHDLLTERPQPWGCLSASVVGNTASLGCLAWSWLEAMDDDGVQESGRCWFGVFSGLETVVGPTAFAGRAPARSGPHPGPGELSDRARP